MFILTGMLRQLPGGENVKFLVSQTGFNPRPNKGGGYHSPSRMNFPCRPKTKKEGDQSHLGNLNYFLCGHFDEKIWG